MKVAFKTHMSIRILKLQVNILNYVGENEKRCENENNSRGKIIYNLLKTIFLSADSTNNIDLSAAIGIPPVYTIDQKLLADESGKIIQQVFFYGDEDGKSFFPRYISAFSPKEWTINNSNVEWVDVNGEKKEGVFTRVPDRSDLPADINENLIVELYSK